MMLHLAYLKIQCLVLLIIPNLYNKLVIRKVHHFVYLSKVLKAKLKVTYLTLMYAMMNRLQFIIFEWSSEVSKEGPLLYLKYNIKDGDKPWSAVSSFEWNIWWQKNDNDGNTSKLQLEHMILNYLDSYTVQCLLFHFIIELEKHLVVREV